MDSAGLSALWNTSRDRGLVIHTLEIACLEDSIGDSISFIPDGFCLSLAARSFTVILVDDYIPLTRTQLQLVGLIREVHWEHILLVLRFRGQAFVVVGVVDEIVVGFIVTQQSLSLASVYFFILWANIDALSVLMDRRQLLQHLLLYAIPLLRIASFSGHR